MGEGSDGGKTREAPSARILPGAFGQMFYTDYCYSSPLGSSLRARNRAIAAIQEQPVTSSATGS